MLQPLLLGLCAAVVVYFVLKRCAGLLLSAAARNKHYKLTVESLGPFICQGIHLQLAQGPLSHIWISEVSLGRSRSAAKVAQAAMSWQFRLPFTVRSLTIELRDSPVGAKSSKKKQNKRRSGSKTLMNSGLRLLLGLLPKVPVRVKQLTVKHQATGFLLDIPRVEVLINSSRLSSKLKLDVKLLPIKAVLESAPGASSSRKTETCRLLELQHITASIVLQVTNQAMGLHCVNASVDVGNAVLTASTALLSALTTLAVLGKQNKAAHLAGVTRLKHTKSGSKNLTVATFDKLVASLPDEVQVSLPSIGVQSSALQSSVGLLETSFESRNVLLTASRATGPYSGDPQAPTSQHPLASSNEEQLYTVSITSDGAHAGLGLTNSHAAGTVSISKVSLDLHLNRAVPTSPQSAAGSDPAAAVLRGHAISETQIEVVADSGVVLLGCGVDMVTLRAASGDGSSMKAQSAADIVAQLSLQGLQMQVLTSEQETGSQKEQTGQSVQQLKHVVGMQKLGVGMSSQTTNDASLCTGNVAVTGCEVHLTHSMLIDLASLGVSLAPPKGILRKSKGPGLSITDPISSPTAPLTSKSKKSKLNVQLTKVAVGISNMVVGYQTVLEVARADRPEDEEAPLTLTCTECITLQELTAEAFPSGFKGSVQANNLAVLHQETPNVSPLEDSPYGPKQSPPHHEVEVLHAKHLTLAFDTASQTPPTALLGMQTQQGSVLECLPNLAATLLLAGWHTVFHADAVIGLCKAAADFACVTRQTATSLQPTETEAVHTSSSTGQMPMTNPTQSPVAEAAATAPAQDTEASVTRQLTKLHRLPAVVLTVQVSKWTTDAVIADHIVWGINLSEAQCKLDSRTLVAIQLQHLQPQLTHQQQQQLSRGAEASTSSLQDSAAVSESPSLSVRHIEVSLNRKPLLHCGEVEASLDLWPACGRDSAARHNLPGSPRRQASLDWTWSDDQHAAAYSRAGLPQWAAECLSEPGEPSDFASQAAAPPAMPLRPAAVVQATVSDVVLKLPYDQDFGRAERFGELWSKAFGQVLHEHLNTLKKHKDQATRKVKRAGLDVKSLLLPLELRLVLQGTIVKFEHHPMEAWLSLHGPLLRDMACQEALWSRAVAADAPTPDEANSSAAAPSEARREQFVQEFTADAPARLQSQQATLDALSVERSRQYKVMCDGLRVASKEDSKQGALMHVAVEGAQARLIVLGSDPNFTQAAMDFIARVDPPSEGVPMRQVQKLHVDVAVQGVAVDFCNNPQPLATAISSQFHGTIAVGRQVTAPPHLYSRCMAVGRHRHTQIGVTVKGSRALVKVYTDVHLTVQQAAACYGVGLEPVIAMISQAGKRLSPTEPDKLRPKPAALPWWDMMRFAWRGGIAITATDFQFSLISGGKLEAMAATQRLQLNAAAATVRLAYGGQLIVDTSDLTAQAFKAAGLDQPAGTLLALPLLDFPCGQYILSSNWHMSSGRDGNQHHLFPVCVPTGPEARQGPMLPADHFKSSALDIDLRVVVGSLSTVTGASQEGDRSLQRLHSHASADSSAIVFLGDHQVVFMKEMMSVLQQPPAWLKFPVRFGTYFLPVDKRRAPSTKLPRLFDHFDISVRAGPLDVVHYTIDPDDPSNGVCLSMTMGTWQGKMLMNQPNPRPAPQGASSHEKNRQAARVATQMLSMALQTDKLCISANEAGFDDAQAMSDSQGRLMELMSGSPSAAQPPASYRHLLGAASADAFIVSIESVSLTQTAGSSQDHRPLKALVHNCQLLVDLAGRNAIWGAAAHLFMAFKPLVPAPKHSPPGTHQPPGTPGLHHGRSGLQRGHSGVPSPAIGGKGLLQQGSFTRQGGELLRILSQQDQAMTDKDVEEPVADAAAHLVGEADGAPTDGRDEELQDALAAETQQKDDVQAAQQEQTAVEDSNSRVTFEVEVVHFQAYLQAEMAPGRFLLAAEKGRVQGRSMPHLFQSLITLTLDQVQAHVAQTEVDPGAAVAWLCVTDAGMEASPTGSQLIRRVFDPFKIQLRISQSAGAGSVASPDTSPAKTSAKPAANAQVCQGQEIRLVVPEIGVVMDSREFEVLTDVISNVGLAQGPHVDSVVQDKRLLLGQGPAKGPAVDGARDMFTYLCQYLASLEAEAFTVRSRLEAAMQRHPSGRSHSGASRAGSGPLCRSAHVSQEPIIIDELADVPTALHNYFQSLVQSQGDKLNHDRLVAQGEGLLVRWSGEQSLAAMQGLQAAREALLDLQAQSNKQTLNQNAKRFTLELDAIKWHLCQDRTPFVDASIVGVMLDSIQNKDLSGSSKLIIQKIEVKDRQGLVGEAPGLEPGMIVSAWNPDESWAQDALLRVNATKGVPTAELTVWSLVDVMVHPLGVHIHQQVANSLWEYFFPKEDAAAKQRQQQWVKSVASRRKSAAVTGEATHGGFPATSKSALGGSGHSRGEGGSGSTTASAAADRAVSAVTQSPPPGSPTSPTATSPVFSLGRRSRHRRISSWDANLEGRKGVDPSLISPTSSGDLTTTRSKASGSVFRRLHKRSASHGEELTSGRGVSWSGSGSGAARPPSAKKASQKAVIKQKKLLFVHFAINRVHCRVTYKGAPFNIKDFKVLLDAQVYEDLEGRWVDLFNRMKWDIVKSVLKSVAGLQGRKFKELLPDHLLKETKSAGDKGKGIGKQWPFGWGKKKGDKEHEALPSSNAEILKARQKKKMMFGEQHLVRFGSMTKPADTDPLGDPQDAMDPQQASTSNSTAAEAAPTAASRARAFVNRALASASQGPKSPTRSPTHYAPDHPHSPDSPHSPEPRHLSSTSLPGSHDGSQYAVMPSYHSSDSLGRNQSNSLDASGTAHPILEGPRGSGQSVQSEMLPQEASFRELPGDNNWPSAAAAAPAHSEGSRRNEDHPRDSAAESGSEARIMMHCSQDGHQHASDILGLSGQKQMPQGMLHAHQQLPRQLQQQLSGNPFLSSTPSPFASSSGAPMAGAPVVPEGLAGDGARSQASQAEDHVHPEWQQAGRGNSDGGMRNAGSGLQPLPPGALSSTPSLAEMLSDLHPAGSREPRRSGNPFMDDDSDDGDVVHMPPVAGLAMPVSSPHQASQTGHAADASPTGGHPRAPGGYPGASLPSDAAPGISKQEGLDSSPNLPYFSHATQSMPGGLQQEHEPGLGADQQHGHLLGTMQPADTSSSPRAYSLGMDVSRQSIPPASISGLEPAGQLPDNQQAYRGQNQYAALLEHQQQQVSARDQIAASPALEPGAFAEIDAVPDVHHPGRQSQAAESGAQPDQQGSKRSPEQSSAVSLPAQSVLEPNASAEMLVPSRPAPKPPVFFEGQGSLPVPRRPAPSRPGMESAQPLEAQGSIPVPRRPAPSIPDLAPALPLQGQGSMPAQLASSRSSQAAGMPVEGQSGMSVPVQWHDTSRPSPEAALPLAQWDSISMTRQPLLPTSMPPPDLPSRQVLAARQSGQASQAEGPSQSQGSGQTQGPGQMPGLEGGLGRAAPDSEEEEDDSEVSAQDRQKFMQSLQSPDRGSTRTKTLAKGFGRMRAKAKDLMQARTAGAASGGPAGQPAPAQGAPKGRDAELGRGGRLARDMNSMFAGLKKPANQ
ncbi:hypothetical protein WJX77_002651 [Trebouxia sp. C0004]